MGDQMKGRVALITGAARGLGRAICSALADAGASIVATDLSGLDETVSDIEAIGTAVIARDADVRNQSSVDAVIEAGLEEFGRLDIVVANAGISGWSRFWEMTEDEWSTMLDINLSGVWRTFKAAAPAMVSQGQGGSMIAISSVAGLKALPGQGHYVAAKHGVVGLVRTAAVELGPYSIRVNSIHPWGIDTPLAQDHSAFEAIVADNPSYAVSFGSILPEPRLADPEDIANAVLWLASDVSRCVTGIQLPVDMGATSV
jgi:SDR family mycofactocin-dependent oxidoreductase